MEAKVILVAGLLEHDSGKTWTVIGLTKALRGMGVRAAPFKPVAGFNLWYSRRAVRYSFERGFLVSNDLLAYIEHLGLSDVDAVIANPYAIGLMYPDLQRVGGVARYLAAVESVERSIVVSRSTLCGEKSFSVMHLFFPDNVKFLAGSARELVTSLASRLGAVEGDPRRFIEELSSSSRNILSCLESLLERSRPHVVVLESFNNAVQPFSGAARLASLFVVVAPSKLLVYDGGKLREAVEVMGEHFATTVDKIYPLLTPVASYEIPQVDSPDKLADYYRDSVASDIAKLLGLT